MDASRSAGAKDDPRFSIDAALAKRVMLANDLRNIADEIEAGVRTVLELCTTEHVQVDQHLISALFLRTSTKKR